MKSKLTAEVIRQTCIVMPAYNEERSVAGVIREIQNIVPKMHVVVIDDCSTDNTSVLARNEGVVVIRLPINLGIGGAVQAGLRYALNNGFSHAIQVDADGQHDPKYIPELLSIGQKYDMVVGSRYVRHTPYRGSWTRHIGIKVFSLLIRMMCNNRITDPTSGYRVFNARALSYLSRTYPVDFPEPESIVSLLKNGYTIHEVSVEMRNRNHGRSSLSGIKSLYLVFSICISILVSGFQRKQTI